MADHGLPLLFAVMIWWASTGVIMILCALPRRFIALSLGIATALAGVAAWAVATSAHDVSALGAYVAFGAALALWGWLEMTFLTGLITGPRTTPCPAGAAGWRRFRLATEALLYHELAIAAVAVLVVVLTWDAPNQIGTFTFLILFGMRISAKLNIFLGVPNLTDEFMPPRIAYLKTYFRKAERNPLFPISIAVSTAIAALLAWRALGAEAGGADAVGFTLLFTLLALAIVEHGFMVLPVRDAALWRWAMPAQTAGAKERRP
jgi:putative photosynthetic complex assembly protein 2